MLFSTFFVLSPVVLFVVLIQYLDSPVPCGLATLAYLGLIHLASERWRPSEPQPPVTLTSALRGAVHALVYSFAGGLLTVVALQAGLSEAREVLGLPALAEAWFWPGVLLVLLLGDLIDYGRHRVEHRVGGILWRLHAVHHSIIRFSTFHGSRVHPLEPILVYGCYGLAAGLLGATQDQALAAVLLAFTMMAPQHAAVRLELGWLDRVLVGRAVHVRHHDLDLLPACNLGNVLTMWDRLFGTWKPPTDAPFPLGIRPFERGFPEELSTQAMVLSPSVWQRLQRWAESRNGEVAP